MPLIVRMEVDRGEIPLLQMSDAEAMDVLAAKLAEQLGGQQRLANPEFTRYGRELAEGDAVVFWALFDQEELELVQQAIADLEVQDPAFAEEEGPELKVVE